MTHMTRRALLAGGATAGVAAAGAAFAAVGRRFGLMPPDAEGLFGPGHALTYAAHRLFSRNALAREFPRHMIAEKPFANYVAPPTPAFATHQAEGFANWALDVRGQVDRPVSLRLDALRGMPQRSQVTSVTCEEGWSYIAEWSGTPLSAVLEQCGAHRSAKYVVYASADGWTDSIDIDEAMHPQTLLAWRMNGAPMPVPFGGPLRMRVPRQLGYKSVKFVEKLLVTDSAADLQLYKGLDRYAWYSGV